MEAERLKSGELEGSPTILLVDDDELMREVTSLMIEDQGGIVLTAVNGFEAVDVFKAHREMVDVVCLDFSMPGRNGYETYLELKKIDPKVGVIMISGLRMSSEVEDATRSEGILFLAKPFQEADLIAAIKKARKIR